MLKSEAVISEEGHVSNNHGVQNEPVWTYMSDGQQLNGKKCVVELQGKIE